MNSFRETYVDFHNLLLRVIVESKFLMNNPQEQELARQLALALRHATGLKGMTVRYSNIGRIEDEGPKTS